MKRLVLVAALVFALALSATASAGSYIYGSTRWWDAGAGAGSSFSPSWVMNTFWKDRSKWTTVTFIDNTGYNWRFTTTTAGTSTTTYWFSSETKKAHCVARESGFFGTCYVYN